MSAEHHDPHKPSPFRRFIRLIEAERRDLGIAVAYSVLIGVLSLALPVAIQGIVNTVSFGTVLQPVIILTILLGVALAASGFFQVARFYVVEMVQRRLFVRLASDVTDALLRVRGDAFDRRHGPELVNRFLDVVTVQKSFSLVLLDGLTFVMQTVIGLALLAAYHPYLLVFDLALIACMLIVLFALARGAVRTSIGESTAKYNMLAWLQELARRRLLFRSRHGAGYALRTVDRLATQYAEKREAHFKILLRQLAGLLTLQTFALAGLLGIGGYLVLLGELTLGQLVAAELVVSFVVGGFEKFGKSLEAFYDLQSSLDKLGYVTDLPSETGGTEAMPGGAGPAHLRLNGVRFGYTSSQRVLKKIDLDVPPGANVAIHARNAQGKSTLLDLVYCLRSSYSGSIELDGVNARDVRMIDLRSQMMLIRGIDLFPGSVIDNVRLSLDAGIEEASRALRLAGAYTAVSALPDGLRSTIGINGVPLSPSEALRVTLARAILCKPRLLLLDEVLDQIDDLRAEGPLVSTLFAKDAPWTMLVTTENPEILPLCDKVYVLSGGALEEERVHESK